MASMSPSLYAITKIFLIDNLHGGLSVLVHRDSYILSKIINTISAKIIEEETIRSAHLYATWSYYWLRYLFKNIEVGNEFSCFMVPFIGIEFQNTSIVHFNYLTFYNQYSVKLLFPCVTFAIFLSYNTKVHEIYS